MKKVRGHPRVLVVIPFLIAVSMLAIALDAHQVRAPPVCNITFDQTGVGSGFTGTVITIDGLPYAVGGLPVSFSWDNDSVHVFSFASPLSEGGVQYMWDNTAGLSNVQNDSLTVTQTGTITGNYKTQCYLTVTSAYDSPSPASGWFDFGSGIAESVMSPVSGGPSTQYVCTGWTGSGSVPSSGGASSVTFAIDAASTITWNWKTQYQVTFDQTGVGLDFAGTVVSVDGLNYAVGDLPVIFWWDSGSSHNFSFASPLVGSDKQYSWGSTAGLSTLPSDTLTAISGGSVTGDYVVQNQVSFDQVGASSDFTDTIVTVDSVSYSRAQLPISFAWAIGSVHSFAFQSPLMVGANSKQYVWTSTTGLSSLQTDSITVTAMGSIVGTYKTQFYLAITSQYSSPSPSSGWFDSGSGIIESVTSPVSGGSGVQRVCTGWTGTGDFPASGTGLSVTFIIDQPSVITWNWNTQYYLTVISPNGSPNPVSGWFNAGSSVRELINSPVYVETGTQNVCMGWSGTGSAPASGSTSSVAFTINTPSSVTWNWKTQYQLTISSAHSSTTGEGWYDSGSTTYATLAAGTVSDSPSIQYVFVDWTGDASGSNLNSSLIIMNAPKTAIAYWKSQYYLTVTSTYSTPSGSGWYDDGSVAYARLDNGTDSGTGDIQYIFIGWSGDASGTVYSQSNGITMNGPKTATANWTAARHALTILSPYGSLGGSTNPSAGVYPTNESSLVTVTATPDVGYTFEYWVLDDQNLAGNQISISMNTDHILTPVFRLLTFTLAILHSNNGMTTPAAGTYSYNYGTNVTITASPTSGYEFDHWLLDNANVTGNPTNVTIDGNHTLQPIFQNAPVLPSLGPTLTMYLTIFVIVGAISLAVFAVIVIIERRR